ncbi:MAG: hypothetical protein AAB263_06565, partial [Planctomycetota bacterium]
PNTVALLLGRLSDATRQQRPWAPVLRGLRLEMPWPWPFRLGKAADGLAAGQDAADVLASSNLLPSSLRTQAAQALRQGPEAFMQWCTAITRGSTTNPLAVRQQAFLLAELAAIIALLHFLNVYIFPSFERMIRELNLTPPPLLVSMRWFAELEVPLLLGVISLVISVIIAVLTRRWQRRRRHAAARLLLIGSQARLPESALGNATAFPALCNAAGWRATTPAELARELARAEMGEAQRAAWLPSVLAAAAPLLAAIPIGLMIIGVMQMLLSILYQIEAQS